MLQHKKVKFLKTAIKVIFFVSLIAVFSLPANLAAAAEVSLGLEYGSALNLGTRDIRAMVIDIVNVLLGFLGVIAVLIVLYGGYLYMTSQGDREKIEKAKKILINGAIGLVIILLAFAIVTFLVNQLAPVTVTGPAGGGGGTGIIGGGALGGGVLEAVYPEPGATNVPRNTLIMVMFNEEMDVTTIINQNLPPGFTGCNNLPPGVTCGIIAGDNADPNVKVINQSENGVMVPADEVVVMTNDNKSYVFDPINYLGNANNYTNYSVNLSENISRANGFSAFMAGGYTWSFEVSNVLDLTPPFITEVIPNPPPGERVYMNAVVQINFNEAVNVVGATMLQNIMLFYNGTTATVTGSLVVSNLFKTVEFISSQPCPMPPNMSTNSCGEVPFCLPPMADITPLIKAALVNPATHETIAPLSGITDAAANSLDGGEANLNNSQQCELNGVLGTCNLNGQADGRPADGSNQFDQNIANDNFWWNFSTNNELDLTPPEIIEVMLQQGAQTVQESLSPPDEDDLVPRNKYVKAIFDEYLMSSTLNTTNYKVFNENVCTQSGQSGCLAMASSEDWPTEVCDYTTALDGECLYPRGGFTIQKDNYSTLETTNHGTLNDVTRATLKTYYPYLDGLERYNSRMTSDVKDMYQNCFNPSVMGQP